MAYTILRGGRVLDIAAGTADNGLGARIPLASDQWVAAMRPPMSGAETGAPVGSGYKVYCKA